MICFCKKARIFAHEVVLSYTNTKILTEFITFYIMGKLWYVAQNKKERIYGTVGDRC